MLDQYNFNIVYPKIKVVDDAEQKSHKTFEIEPLESGFGTTIGNALRRIALSTLPGGAVKKIKIAGVAHEFDILDNAIEDVTTIILSLKELNFRMDSQDEEYVLHLRSNKAGELFAKDIECPAGVEVLNGDLKIVTLNKDEPFEMEIIANKGRGYTLSEQNRNKEKKANEIFVDSIYSPITKFSFRVEDTRVGDKTNYDKLIVDIWTNGMLTPEEALSYSAKIMNSHMELLVKIEDTIQQSQVFEEVLQVQKDDEPLIKREETSIEALDISNRAYNGLKRANVNTIEELCVRTKKEIASLDNIGSKTVDEIEKQLLERGMNFKED